MSRVESTTLFRNEREHGSNRSPACCTRGDLEVDRSGGRWYPTLHLYDEDMTPSRYVYLLAQHVEPPARHSGATLSLKRGFASTKPPSRGRNILAKYAPRPISQAPSLSGDPFLTSSTQPVGTSFQTVPPPNSAASKDGVLLKDPIPAMVPSSAGAPSTLANAPCSTSQKRGEITVRGVVIPPKPIPPGEEGKSTPRNTSNSPLSRFNSTTYLSAPLRLR